MRVQEAIKAIKDNKPTSGYYILCEALDMAIKALEKQIPKKPDLEGDGYWNGQLIYDTWICPCCEEHYEVDYEKYDCCPNCGQVIDWSEQNE